MRTDVVISACCSQYQFRAEWIFNVHQQFHDEYYFPYELCQTPEPLGQTFSRVAEASNSGTTQYAHQGQGLTKGFEIENEKNHLVCQVSNWKSLRGLALSAPPRLGRSGLR